MSAILASPAVAPRGAMPPLIVACLAATWVIWGSTYLAIKWALVSFPPFFQMGTRFVAAGLLLGAWVWWRGSHWPTRREWINAFISGTLMLGAGYGFTALAEVHVSSGLVVAFIAVGPALQAAMEWPYGIRPSRTEAAGMLLGLAGVVGLAFGQGFSASMVGLTAIVLSMVGFRLGGVWTVHGMPGGRSLALAPGAAGYASQMFAGGLVLLVMSWAFGESLPATIDPVALASWLYLVVAGSLIAYSAFMLLLQRTPTAVSSSYSFVNPVIGVLLGVTLGGEVVGLGEWVAIAVILASVALLLRGKSAGLAS